MQAELFARAGKTALARSELAAAEQLKPGLPFANPRSVQELKAQLGQGGGVASPGVIRTVPAAPRFPWGTVLILAGSGRHPADGLSPPHSLCPVSGGRGGTGRRAWNLWTRLGPATAPPRWAAAIGSGIAGGLASGLAVGAGVVAGEELAHHFLDGGRGGGVIPPAEAGEPGAGNADMGGSDFGVNDPGSGWDDGGGFGGDSGGGGDWS